MTSPSSVTEAGHVVQRLEPVVGVDAQTAVVLEQDHPVAGAEPRGGAAVVGDLAAGDEDPHGASEYACV
jgi:predicted aconitase with swiveling domain